MSFHQQNQIAPRCYQFFFDCFFFQPNWTQVLAVYLMAAKLGVPVCPHAGGVGLCNMVPHLQVQHHLPHLSYLHHPPHLHHLHRHIILDHCQAFDFVCLSGSVENRLVEWVDHLHQHFKCPPRVENGRCVQASDDFKNATKSGE